MNRSVLLLGEALVDELPGGPVAAGAPLNVAAHLRALGGAPLLISRIGADDAAARRIEAALQRFGLEAKGVQRDLQHPTGTVQVQMRSDGSHRFLIAEGVAWDHLDREQALQACAGLRPAFVYFGSLAQRHPVSREAIRALLHRVEAPRFLDLNLREGASSALALESLGLTDWLKVNEDELAQLLRWSGCAGAPALVRQFELQRLIVTRGPDGYFSLDALGDLSAEGSGVPDVLLVDSVGAGDAFSACLLAAHLQRKEWAASLALANRFAAAICGQAGASASDPASFYPPWRAALAALPESPDGA
jgi:fructokinase